MPLLFFSPHFEISEAETFISLSSNCFVKDYQHDMHLRFVRNELKTTKIPHDHMSVCKVFTDSLRHF